ncbi:hypothetical protein CpipJ_CPIJ006513 [Culex quinquefasciatus]|uniref:Uncharacterized protein n=1 Tax=Culex quinquefasciatus TaxID=7176 RepID=B0WHL3_CULQU|nr:hypothetical protein CpipJ_CPIJ006513 [Culex quinquefasciatus]|eukprot:XP_001848197.1 hypothetical protein CpipJ_CPIJ006513 [Culex quinquefasciatus]
MAVFVSVTMSTVASSVSTSVSSSMSPAVSAVATPFVISQLLLSVAVVSRFQIFKRILAVMVSAMSMAAITSVSASVATSVSTAVSSVTASIAESCEEVILILLLLLEHNNRRCIVPVGFQWNGLSKIDRRHGQRHRHQAAHEGEFLWNRLKTWILQSLRITEVEGIITIAVTEVAAMAVMAEVSEVRCTLLTEEVTGEGTVVVSDLA